MQASDWPVGSPRHKYPATNIATNTPRHGLNCSPTHKPKITSPAHQPITGLRPGYVILNSQSAAVGQGDHTQLYYLSTVAPPISPTPLTVAPPISPRQQATPTRQSQAFGLDTSFSTANQRPAPRVMQKVTVSIPAGSVQFLLFIIVDGEHVIMS